METTKRVPPTEITGLKGALVKRMTRRRLGQVPTAMGVMWHNPRVLFASARVIRCEEALPRNA